MIENKIPRSLDFTVSDTGVVKNDGRVCKLNVLKNGYVMVNIRFDTGDWRGIPVHRLVLESFKGPAPKGYTAGFKDGNKANCDVNNLMWIPKSSGNIGKKHKPEARTRKAWLRKIDKESRDAHERRRKLQRAIKLRIQLARMQDDS